MFGDKSDTVHIAGMYVISLFTVRRERESFKKKKKKNHFHRQRMTRGLELGDM